MEMRGNPSEKTQVFWKKVTEFSQVHLSRRKQKSTLACTCFKISFNAYRQQPVASFTAI